MIMSRNLYVVMGGTFLIGAAVGIEQSYIGLLILNVVAYSAHRTKNWA